MNEGRAWVFGNDVNTNTIAPSGYLLLPTAELARHAMEATNPAFASSVRAGDVVVAGDNFGCGSTREQAAEALRYLGIAAVVATSFARTFYRNALNVGLPALVCPEAGNIEDGARLRTDIEQGLVQLVDGDVTLRCQPIPPHLMEMIRDGGLLLHLEKRLKQEARQ